MIILGPSGLIGSEIVRQCQRSGRPHLVVTRSMVDLDAPLADKAFLLQGQSVIYAAGYSPYHGKDFNHNIRQVANVCEAKPAHIVYLSTCDVYGNAERISEDTKPSPVTPYADSKLLCEKYLAKSSIPHMILRVGSTFGGGDDGRRSLVGRLIKKIRSGETIDIPHSHRTLTGIDTIAGAAIAASASECTGRLNAVANNVYSMAEIVRILEDK